MIKAKCPQCGEIVEQKLYDISLWYGVYRYECTSCGAINTEEEIDLANTDCGAPMKPLNLKEIAQMPHKIVNLYIELIPNDLASRGRLWALLKEHGFSFLDATDYDSYTSGPCALDSLDAIADDIRKCREL